jgi:hypothetical protein
MRDAAAATISQVRTMRLGPVPLANHRAHTPVSAHARLQAVVRYGRGLSASGKLASCPAAGETLLKT